jgi:uncharacterized protein YacL
MARQTKAQIAATELAAATLAAEQQAELKRLRAEKRDTAKQAKLAAATVGIDTTPVTLDKPAFSAAAEFAKRQAEIAAAWETLIGNFELPNWKRSLTAAVLAIAAAGVVGYGMGIVVGMLMIATFAATSMAWLSYVIMALGIALAYWVGRKVGAVVFNYIADKKVDDHYESAKSKVLGWFKTKPAPVVVQFTGAHAA